MPSSVEAMIQNMIQAGIPHAQMMQFLQTMQVSDGQQSGQINS
jgi:hypothetical protein